MMSTVSEKLLQVAQNNPKVYHSGQLNIVKNAECLKGSKSGSAMLLDDVSPVSHDMGVKVRSKNLIPYPFIYETIDSHGITFTDNKDGTITLKGKNDRTEISNYNLFNTSDKLSFLKPNTDYYLSCNLDIIRSLRTVNSSGAYKYYSYGNINFSPDETPDRLFIQIKTTDTTTYDNTVVKLQIEEGTTATAYTPYVPDLTAVKVKRCGKNLIPYPYSETTKTQNKVTFTDNGDGSITIKGTATADTYFWLCTIDFGDKPINAISVDSATNGIYTASKRLYYNQNSKGSSINIISGTTVEETIYPQIELGTIATDYEPYITPTEYTPTADGIVNGVTSLYPNTTLMTDTDGVMIDCEYYKDIDKTFNELTTSVALSGGDS